MDRYALTHSRTATVTFPDVQSAADFAFNFRHSPDFSEYILTDRETGNYYSVKNLDNGIEFAFGGCRQ